MLKREENLRRTGDVKSERARASYFCAKHVPHLHGSITTTRQSMASRILASGLLLTPRLRCSSCQGPKTVTRVKANLHQLRCRPSTANTGRNPASLLYAAQISQRDRTQFRGCVTAVTNVTIPGTHRAPINGSLSATQTQPHGGVR